MDGFLIVAAVIGVVVVGAMAAALIGWISRFLGGTISLVAALLLTTILAIIYKQQVPIEQFGSAPITLFGVGVDVRIVMVLLAVVFLIAGWLVFTDKDLTQRVGNLSSTALALIPLAIAINIAMGQIVQTIKLPIYLDSIGTVLVGALMGPWVALLTGALSNVIWTLSGLPNSGPLVSFAYVAAVIGLIAGFAGRAGVFQRQSPRWLSALVGGIFVFALTLFILMFINRNPDPNAFPPFPNARDLIRDQAIIFVVTTIVGLAFGYFVIQRAGYAGIVGLATGVVAAILSAPMAAIVYGGVTGAGTDLLVAAYRASGGNILDATLAQGITSDPFDKMTSFLIVWLIVQSLPRRVLGRFPNIRAAESLPPIGGSIPGRSVSIAKTKD
jgi:hypothetical protein